MRGTATAATQTKRRAKFIDWRLLPRYHMPGMTTSSHQRRQFTVIGQIAAAIASLSARYFRTIALQVSRVARKVYQAYRRFEDSLVTAATDMSLFFWALRNFVLIIGVEIILILGSFRWPLLWLPTVLFAILLITAAVEVARRRTWDDDGSDADENDTLRSFVYLFYAWLLRISLIVGGLSLSGYYMLYRSDTRHNLTLTGSQVVDRASVLREARPTQIGLRNDCRTKKLWVAINVRDKRGRWVTHAWYGVNPGAYVDDVVTGYSPIAYLYAFSGRSVWKADDGQPGRLLRIKYEKMIVTSNQLAGSGVEQVRFFTVELSPTGQHTHVFTCNG